MGWDVDVNDYEMTDSDALVPALAQALTERERAGATHAIVLLHSWPPVPPRPCASSAGFLVERADDTVTVDQVPGHGAVATMSPVVGRARTLARQTRAVLSHQA